MWLPIFAWVIDHPEGPIVVDTGATACASDPRNLPRWHPYHRWAVRMSISEEDEIGPQMIEKVGIDPASVPRVVLTHLHADHAGGLHHFPNADIFVSEEELSAASGLPGRLRGYLPNRWPDWLEPRRAVFAPNTVGAFGRSFPLTTAGDVWAVRTSGHTQGHMSVLVRTEEADYLLAGDTSYTQSLLLQGQPDGVSARSAEAVETMRRIRTHASLRPTVYLPSHDPGSLQRLAETETLQAPRYPPPTP